MAKVLHKSKLYDKLDYVPHRYQLALHNDAHRFRVISNGRRWGKTFWGAREVTPRSLVTSHITGEPQQIWIVGPQYTDAEKEFRIVYDDMRKLGIDKECIRFANNAESGALVIKTNWGFVCEGKSAKHPETLVGEGLDFVLMVEAGRHKRRTWGQYIRPTLSDHRGGAAFTGVPEGKSENSLLYALWERGQDKKRFSRWKSWREPSWNNRIVFPGGRQDPEILEAEEDLTEDEFNRQYGAMFVDKVGSVLQEWDDETHLGNFEFNPELPVYGAVDYGFTNPFVFLFIQVDYWNHVYVIAEYRRTQMDTPQVAQELKTMYPHLISKMVRFYPDPAEPDDTMTLANSLHVAPGGDTGGLLKTRLSLIRMSLKTQPTHVPTDHPDRKPQLFVDRSCKMLAWEAREGYRWPERQSDIRSDSEQPLDKDNHSVEALGRFFRGHFGVPGEDRRPKRSRIVVADMG